MKNKQFAFAAVGVAIGFILGFFVAQAVSLEDRFLLQGSAAGPGAQASQPRQGGSQGLPQDHPSVQLMELIRNLQQRARENPRDAEVRIALGNAFYDMKRFGNAITWYQEALALQPKNINVSTDLGTSYYYVGQPQNAIEQLQRSLEIDPAHPQTLQNLGVVYESLGRHEDALAVWQHLMETNPEYRGLEQVRESIARVRAKLEQDDT